MYRIETITNKALLRHYFEQDRALCGYALGDLDEKQWQVSHYLGAFQGESLESVGLIWHGVVPPVVIQFGSDDAASDMLAQLPDKFFYMLSESLLPLYQRHFEMPAITYLWRMVLDRANFRPVEGANGLRRLTEDDVPLLKRLYGSDGPRADDVDALSASQIKSGVFFGIFRDGALLAVAGSHFLTPSEGVASVGYVYTAPDERGKGYAKATTSAVVQTFFELGIRDIVLNVARPNIAAIRSYEQLGFRIHAAIIEGYGIRFT